MSLSGISSRTSLSMQSILDMRAQLDDLQRQLGTGRKTTTYAGLGINRGLTVSLNNQLSALSGYDANMDQAGVRLTLAQTALGQMGTVSQNLKTAALKSSYAPDSTGQTSEQRVAGNDLDLVLGLLNSRAGDRYLFSGGAHDQKAVEGSETILNGEGGRAGLKQIISERRQADLGVDGLGRLVIPASAGSTVSMSEDVAGSPFGMKLSSITSTLAGGTVAGPTGTPPGVSIDLGATNPAAGETVKMTFTLPDGTTTDLTLTATNSTPPGPNEFTIGADPTATAANLQATLTSSVRSVAGGEMTAASAMAASDSFFNADVNNPPMRVAGPPFNNSTGFTPGTADDTVIWYTGDAGSDPARSTSTVRIDDSITVSYGMRANEDALRDTVRNLALFAAVSFSSTDPNAKASYDGLKERVADGLDTAPGRPRIADLQGELASVQTAMKGASDRHDQTNNTLTDLLESIRSIPPEEAGAKILALQTNLQASLQTTAMLMQTSLVNFL
jgi:flagellar hook-associated protein 3 FlgL